MRHRSYVTYLVLVASIFLLNGCASTIVGMIKNQPAFNWTYIPHELQKGDASTYRSFDGSQSWRLEVTDVKDDAYYIKMYWLTADESVSFLKDLSYYFVVGKVGYVRSAEIQDASGARTPLKIAGPGDFGYIENPTPVKLKRPEWVNTPLGKFEVTEIVIYNSISSIPLGGSSKLTCVNFISDKTPFGSVMQRNTSAIELPLSRVVELASMLTPINGIYQTLSSYLLSLNEKNTASAGNVIISDK
jgi:hypothetical protein